MHICRLVKLGLLLRPMNAHVRTYMQAEAEAAFEAKKQEVEEKTREEAEAKAADQQVRALCQREGFCLCFVCTILLCLCVNWISHACPSERG